MNRSGFVGEMGVNFFEKEAQVNGFSIHRHPGMPFLCRLVPINALIGTATTWPLCFIGIVLSACAWPKIIPSVVQSIPTQVVNFLKVKSCSFRNYTVHPDYFTSRTFRGAIMATRVVGQSVPGATEFQRIPIPLHKEVVVNSVNDGKLSLRELDEASTCLHSVRFNESRFCLSDDRLSFLKNNYYFTASFASFIRLLCSRKC